MKKIFILVFSTVLFIANAQNFRRIDQKMMQFQSTFDENAIADVVSFINNNFSTETDKLRAVFVWITENFEYDVGGTFNIELYTVEQEIINSMLRNRKGVCLHYVHLFAKIANELGIKTYIAVGITRQNNTVNNEPHAWNVSLVDSVWRLIDPTWGAGFRQNRIFVQQRNDFFFKTAPEELIQSHYPFDPMWQLLNHPVSAQNFIAGRTEINRRRTFFDFESKLKTHANATRLEQLIAANYRIIGRGRLNSRFALDYVIRNTLEIQLIRDNIAISTYNSAVDLFNKAVECLNEFIFLRNNLFFPRRTEYEIRELMTNASQLLQEAQNELQNINTSNMELINLIMQLRRNINNTRAQVAEQNTFIDLYFNTEREYRRSLFFEKTTENTVRRALFLEIR